MVFGLKPLYWKILATVLCLGLVSFAADDEDVPAPAEKPQIEQLSETKFKVGKIEFDSKSREIRFPALINSTEGIIEYAIVHEGGKTHESLLKTPISPFNLQVVLKLLSFTEGDGDLFHGFYPPGKLPEPEAEGARLDVFVNWGTSDVPIQDLIEDHNLGEAKVMEPLPWVFTGSKIIKGKFQAEVEGSIFAIYRDELALLNTPHPRAVDDDNWFSIPASTPAYETPVTVILRPAKPFKPSNNE